MKKSFLAVLLLACCGFARADESTIREMEKAFADAGITLLKEKIMPNDFSLPLAVPSGTSAKNISLKDFEGKVVFLNFWATWCPPCRAEMPSMEAMYARFKGRGLEILAVNCRESNQAVLSFMKNNKLSFPALLDGSGRVSGIYAVQAIPASYIIDRSGKIIARVVGSLNWDSPQIRTAFDQLLN
ncbi:MAG: TlpA family protein disulfide reductase [Treponema sp.]|jgi:thiol-disulfide isomerase/thioredoxin|nr:TlpA family protein disulfide reductase [Treponema sp.]